MIKEDGSVVFEGKEQEELNRIIEERLAREKSKYADYEDVKGIKEELEALGYEGTAAEIRAAVKARREEYQKQQEELSKQEELEELQRQAEKEGTSPELLKEIKELKKELNELKSERQAVKKAEEEKQKQTEEEKAKEEYYKQQCNELLEKHSVDAAELEKNPKFMKFVKGKTITSLTETYEDFLDFIGETEAEAITKALSKEERSTSGGKGSNSGGSYGLTNDEKALVDDWNRKNPRMQMSYKEFAERKN